MQPAHTQPPLSMNCRLFMSKDASSSVGLTLEGALIWCDVVWNLRMYLYTALLFSTGCQLSCRIFIAPLCSVTIAQGCYFWSSFVALSLLMDTVVPCHQCASVTLEPPAALMSKTVVFQRSPACSGMRRSQRRSDLFVLSSEVTISLTSELQEVYTSVI